MSQAKNRMMEEEMGHYEGGTGEVALNGGYLDIQLDGETIGTVSIPRPNFMAERHDDSVVSWDEEFGDFDGNIYRAKVDSSMNGIEWAIDIVSHDDGVLQSLHNRIKIDLVTTYES